MMGEPVLTNPRNMDDRLKTKPDGSNTTTYRDILVRTRISNTDRTTEGIDRLGVDGRIQGRNGIKGDGVLKDTCHRKNGRVGDSRKRKSKKREWKESGYCKTQEETWDMLLEVAAELDESYMKGKKDKEERKEIGRKETMEDMESNEVKDKDCRKEGITEGSCGSNEGIRRKRKGRKDLEDLEEGRRVTGQEQTLEEDEGGKRSKDKDGGKERKVGEGYQKDEGGEVSKDKDGGKEGEVEESYEEGRWNMWGRKKEMGKTDNRKEGKVEGSKEGDRKKMKGRKDSEDLDEGRRVIGQEYSLEEDEGGEVSKDKEGGNEREVGEGHKEDESGDMSMDKNGGKESKVGEGYEVDESGEVSMDKDGGKEKEVGEGYEEDECGEVSMVKDGGKEMEVGEGFEEDKRHWKERKKETGWMETMEVLRMCNIKLMAQLLEVERENARLREQLRRNMEKKEVVGKEMEKKVGTERKELDRKETERKELDRKEKERKEMRRKEVERKEIERKRMEQRKMVRKENERKEIERKEIERKEVERKETKRREMERKENERKETEITRISPFLIGENFSLLPLPQRVDVRASPLQSPPPMVSRGWVRTGGGACKGARLEDLPESGWRLAGGRRGWREPPPPPPPDIVSRKCLKDGTTALAGMARVELLKTRPLQCYRCWRYGHVQRMCHSKVDRRGACYGCGQTGHLVCVCRNATHCVVCFEAGWEASHRIGGPHCGTFWKWKCCWIGKERRRKEGNGEDLIERMDEGNKEGVVR